MQNRKPNFIEDGKFYMVRCFKCDPKYGKENYTFAVATGQCAWCGDKYKSSQESEHKESKNVHN